MSQTTRVLNYLQSGKTLTPLEALRIFGSMRLQGRIWDIKNMGYTVTTTMIKVNGKHVARYALADLFKDVKLPKDEVQIEVKRKYVKKER